MKVDGADIRETKSLIFTSNVDSLRKRIFPTFSDPENVDPQ